ncbi:MAG: hypothetical protein K9J37_07050 [Saprospiraceae bacterium]|nr:hypothetical protein [Saprospiraceae bacterium]MCF8249653.1 hypothetical protein [Saprospiraceae bacterium]MCF8312360.1 hypothetical protein [Saprospiraceae bacterium]MCF8440643.1 hypothetical protein [Saprospiraceae bacterium]
MKNTIFAALLAVLFVYFGCSKADKSEPAPATPTTEVSNHSNATEGGGNAQVTSRADCSDHTCDCDCCCGLKLITPTGTNVDVEICGAAIGCAFDLGGQCTYGGGCNIPTSNGYGGVTTLNTTSGTGGIKTFCSGGIGDIFEIQNNYAGTVTYAIECGGTASDTLSLSMGQTAIIRKGLNCNILPTTPCVF